jgi:hypothetical protein
MRYIELTKIAPQCLKNSREFAKSFEVPCHFKGNACLALWQTISHAQ